MKLKKLRVVIAGSGMVADHHCLAWSKLPQVEIVAIFSRQHSKARTKAERFGIPAAYDDYQMMLERERPDAVDIATAPEAHREQAVAAADLGAHILCQKPMTPSLVDSLSLVEEIGERVRFMVHENWRFRPQYRQIGRWLQQGRAGSISEFKMSVRSSGLITRTNTGELFALQRQPFFRDLRRFILMELLIHHLDTMRYLLGPLSVRNAFTAQLCPEVVGEDVAEVVLESERGVFGTVTGNFSAAGFPPLPLDDLELIGDRGSILFKNHVLQLLGPAPEEIVFNKEEAYQTSYDNAIRHFLEALLEDTPFETDRLDNLATIRLVEDGYALAGLNKSH